MIRDFILDLAIDHPKFYHYTAKFWDFLDTFSRRIECRKDGHMESSRTGRCINCGKKL